MEEIYQLLLQIIANSPTGAQLGGLDTLDGTEGFLVFKPGEKRPYLIQKDKITFPGEPATTFLSLSDTESTYTGQEGKILYVKTGGGVGYKTIAEVTGVTVEAIESALGYTPADASTVSDHETRITALEGSGGGAIGTRVYSTSSGSGAVDDADISLGSTTFGTDSTTELQNLLDEALNGPLTIVWDGRYSVSSTLKVHGNTRIVARPGCGVILRDHSNCFLMENANVVNPGGAIIDENIVIENLIMNGNGYNTGPTGSDVFDTANNGSATNGSAQTKRNQIINFIGVRNLKLNNIELLAGRYWASCFSNIEYAVLNGTYIDFGDSSTRDDYNYDGIHLKGGVNHFKILNTTIKNAKDDNIALNSHAQLAIYNAYRGPITNVEIDGVFLNSRAMGIGIYSETYRVDEISIKNIKGITQSHYIRITNGEYPSPDGSGNIGKITIDDVGVDVLPGSTLADFGGMIYVRGNVEKLILNNLTKTDFTKDTPFIALTDSDSVIDSLIINGVQLKTNGGTWANSFLSVQDGIIKKCLINNVTHLEETSFINAPIVEVIGGEITDLLLSNIDTEKINSIVTNPNGNIRSIKAVNIGHPGSGNAGFITAGTITEIHLSNYNGNDAISGTFNKKLGSYLDYLGEYSRSNLPNSGVYKGSQIVVTDDDVVGYVRAFSNGTDWIRVTDGGAVTPINVNILLSEDFSGTTVNTSNGAISNPDSANLLVEQNDGIIFTRITDADVSDALNNGWNSANSYVKGSVIAVNLNQVTGSWRGVFAIRWIFNATSDFISIQGDAAGNVRIAIKEANALVYDYTTSGLSIYQRFKIDYSDTNAIKIYYYNAGWVEIDPATSKNYNLGATGTLKLSSSSNNIGDDAGEQIKFNRLRVTDADYTTELP